MKERLGAFLESVRSRFPLGIGDENTDWEDEEESVENTKDDILKDTAEEDDETDKDPEEKRSGFSFSGFSFERLFRIAGGDDEEDEEEEEENTSEPEEEPERERTVSFDWTKLEAVLRFLISTRAGRILLVATTVVCLFTGFFLYNRFVVFDNYISAASYENTAAGGSNYVASEKYIFKYNADGISCLSKTNTTMWSITYSMQAPVANICGGTMAVAEQQGTQVYIVNESGVLGSFQTDARILKVRVSKQGLVALMLQEDNVTWVNLYEPNGNLIVSNKTTIMESGYPIDIAISPDGQRILVSYVKITGGVISDEIIFYHFGAAGQKKENHIVARELFDGMIVPGVYFADNDQAVAVTEHGYVVYTGKDKPEKTDETVFDNEINSYFSEGKQIGFVFENQEEESRYNIELYNLNGKKQMSTKTDFAFSTIRMQHGQILLYNDRGCEVFTDNGHCRFRSEYEKEIQEFFYFGEYRKYLVISRDSFERIRIARGGRQTES